MASQRFHAVVVSGGSPADVALARQRARDLADKHDLGAEVMVTAVIPEGMNLCYSFLVAPDGSTHMRAVRGQEFRDEFIGWLRQRADLVLDWVEVRYADDAEDAAVTRDSRDDESQAFWP